MIYLYSKHGLQSCSNVLVGKAKGAGRLLDAASMMMPMTFQGSRTSHKVDVDPPQDILPTTVAEGLCVMISGP